MANMGGYKLKGTKSSCKNEKQCYLCGYEATYEQDRQYILGCQCDKCGLNFYHTECIQEYLEEQRLEQETKYGFLCPKGLCQGKCNGRITNTKPVTFTQEYGNSNDLQSATIENRQKINRGEDVIIVPKQQHSSRNDGSSQQGNNNSQQGSEVVVVQQKPRGGFRRGSLLQQQRQFGNQHRDRGTTGRSYSTSVRGYFSSSSQGGGRKVVPWTTANDVTCNGKFEMESETETAREKEEPKQTLVQKAQQFRKDIGLGGGGIKRNTDSTPQIKKHERIVLVDDAWTSRSHLSSSRADKNPQKPPSSSSEETDVPPEAVRGNHDLQQQQQQQPPPPVTRHSNSTVQPTPAPQPPTRPPPPTQTQQHLQQPQLQQSVRPNLIPRANSLPSASVAALRTGMQQPMQILRRPQPVQVINNVAPIQSPFVYPPAAPSQVQLPLPQPVMNVIPQGVLPHMVPIPYPLPMCGGPPPPQFCQPIVQPVPQVIYTQPLASVKVQPQPVVMALQTNNQALHPKMQVQQIQPPNTDPFAECIDLIKIFRYEAVLKALLNIGYDVQIAHEAVKIFGEDLNGALLWLQNGAQAIQIKERAPININWDISRMYELVQNGAAINQVVDAVKVANGNVAAASEMLLPQLYMQPQQDQVQEQGLTLIQAQREGQRESQGQGQGQAQGQLWSQGQVQDQLGQSPSYSSTSYPSLPLGSQQSSPNAHQPGKRTELNIEQDDNDKVSQNNGFDSFCLSDASLKSPLDVNASITSDDSFTDSRRISRGSRFLNFFRRTNSLTSSPEKTIYISNKSDDNSSTLQQIDDNVCEIFQLANDTTLGIGQGQGSIITTPNLKGQGGQYNNALIPVKKGDSYGLPDSLYEECEFSNLRGMQAASSTEV